MYHDKVSCSGTSPGALLSLEPRGSIRRGVEKSICRLNTLYKFVNVNILAKTKQIQNFWHILSQMKLAKIKLVSFPVM